VYNIQAFNPNAKRKIIQRHEDSDRIDLNKIPLAHQLLHHNHSIV